MSRQRKMKYKNEFLPINRNNPMKIASFFVLFRTTRTLFRHNNNIPRQHNFSARKITKVKSKIIIMDTTHNFDTDKWVIQLFVFIRVNISFRCLLPFIHSINSLLHCDCILLPRHSPSNNTEFHLQLCSILLPQRHIVGTFAY